VHDTLKYLFVTRQHIQYRMIHFAICSKKLMSNQLNLLHRTVTE